MTDQNESSREIFERLKAIKLPTNGAYPIAQRVLAEIVECSGGTLTDTQASQLANWMMGIGISYQDGVHRRRYRHYLTDKAQAGRVAYQYGYEAGKKVGRAEGKHKRHLSYLRGVQDALKGGSE